MQLFGKQLFSKKKGNKASQLYDFAQHGLLSNPGVRLLTDLDLSMDETPEETKARREKDKKPSRTPKEVYELKMLNLPDKYAFKCDSGYITEEKRKLKLKLDLVKGNEAPSKYAREELSSMIERLENRRRITEFQGVLDEYPHTTAEAINRVVNDHSNLRCKPAEEFIPDFPDDAVTAMEEYRNMCQALCGKDPIFYVIADKKDFGEIDRRRDPILLVQSPFGFAWQILGAWDEEMIYLGDL